MRLYAQGAPGWWPYQLVSLGNEVLPPRAEPGFYRLLVDNGMFAYAKRGERPDLDLWLARLHRFVAEVERLRRPAEVLVILPDWLWDPGFVVKAASHPRARLLCRDYGCYAVAHSRRGEPRGYARTAEELAAMDWLRGLAAPMKLNCARYSPRAGRRIVRRECQLAVAEQVCGVAGRHGLQCHGLGVLLSPDHVYALQERGVTSIDSTAWTRPNASVVEDIVGGRWSAKNQREKDVFFATLLVRLHRAGVVVEDIPLHPSCERACYEDLRCEDDEERGDRHACTKCLLECLLDEVAAPLRPPPW